MVLAHCQVNGVVEITRDELHNGLSHMEDRLASLLTERMTSMIVRSDPQAQEPEALMEIDPLSSHLVHHWGGRFHPVRSGFIFPSDTKVQHMWELWMHGVPSTQEGPYRLIDPKFDFSFDVCSVLLYHNQ